MAWYVYMLRCGDGSLYTGLHHRRGPSAPGAPERDRGQIHPRPASGVAGLHRGGSGPLHRQRREAAIKKLPRKRKLALIEGGTP